MSHNNDPIKEYKAYRWGVSNLTKDDGLSSNYEDDLHACSNDLSEEGSIREEREHAKFAEIKRQERADKYNNINNNNKSNTNAGLQIIKWIFIIFWLLPFVVNVIMGIIGAIFVSIFV